jgi:hypothetical protein
LTGFSVKIRQLIHSRPFNLDAHSLDKVFCFLTDGDKVDGYSFIEIENNCLLGLLDFFEKLLVLFALLPIEVTCSFAVAFEQMTLLWLILDPQKVVKHDLQG